MSTIYGSGYVADMKPDDDGHDSDCGVHNEPAYPDGPCDCGAELPEPALVLRNAPSTAWEEGDYFTSDQMLAFYAKGYHAGAAQTELLRQALKALEEWRDQQCNNADSGLINTIREAVWPIRNR